MAFPVIVDTSDFFYLPYKIPNQSEEVGLQTFLHDHEHLIMRSLLGFALWEEFRAAIVAGSALIKWTDLLNGAEYTYSGYNFKFYGCNDFLVPALYSEWLSKTFDKHTNIGIGINQKEDFLSLNPGPRIAKAWNEFANRVGNPYLYENSLWGFLKANELTYTTWNSEIHFKTPGIKTVFNL